MHYFSLTYVCLLRVTKQFLYDKHWNLLTQHSQFSFLYKNALQIHTYWIVKKVNAIQFMEDHNLCPKKIEKMVRNVIKDDHHLMGSTP